MFRSAPGGIRRRGHLVRPFAAGHPNHRAGGHFGDDRFPSAAGFQPVLGALSRRTSSLNSHPGGWRAFHGGVARRPREPRRAKDPHAGSLGPGTRGTRPLGSATGFFFHRRTYGDGRWPILRICSPPLDPRQFSAARAAGRQAPFGRRGSGVVGRAVYRSA